MAVGVDVEGRAARDRRREECGLNMDPEPAKAYVTKATENVRASNKPLAMPVPATDEGRFEGGLLFDGAGYREPSDIVDFAYGSGRLGLIRHRHGVFRAEFLGLHPSPQFSLPVWDAVRDPAWCGSVVECRALIDDFIGGSA